MDKAYMSIFMFREPGSKSAGEPIVVNIADTAEKAKLFIENHKVYKDGGKGYIIAGLEVSNPESPIVKP